MLCFITVAQLAVVYSIALVLYEVFDQSVSRICNLGSIEFFFGEGPYMCWAVPVWGRYLI